MMDLYFKSIHKRFKQRSILAVQDWLWAAGDSILLTGVNGAGKTTLLRVLAGLEKPDQWSVQIGAQTLGWSAYRQALHNQLVYLHQQPFMFAGNVRHNLEYALPRRLSCAERQARIDKALVWARLETIAMNDAKRVSGGEAQRIALTRAWLREPRFLLLDEPTVNMDTDSRLRTLELLHRLKSQGVALLIASHEPQQWQGLVNRHWHLKDGHLSVCSPP